MHSDSLTLPMVLDDRFIATIKDQREPYCIYKLITVNEGHAVLYSSLRKMELHFYPDQDHETHLFGQEYTLRLNRVIRNTKTGQLVAEFSMQNAGGEGDIQFKRLQNRGRPI